MDKIMGVILDDPLGSGYSEVVIRDYQANVILDACRVTLTPDEKKWVRKEHSGFTFEKFERAIKLLHDNALPLSKLREQNNRFAQMMENPKRYFAYEMLRRDVNATILKHGYYQHRQWKLTKDEKLKWV